MVNRDRLGSTAILMARRSRQTQKS